MKHITLYFLSILLMYVLISIFSYKAYRQCSQLVEDKVNCVFDSIVKLNYGIRLKKSGLTYSFGTSYSKDTALLSKGIRIGAFSDSLIPYSQNIQKETPTKNLEKALEQALIKVSPIDPCELDSLFSAGLKEMGIEGKTNVRTVMEGKEICCSKESKINDSYFFTSIQEQGIDPIVKIQGCIQYSKWSVLRRMTDVWISWGVVVILSVAAFILVYRKRKISGREEEINNEAVPPVAEIQDTSQPEEWIELENHCFRFGEVNFDPAKYHLFNQSKNQEVVLTGQLTELLLLFIKAPDLCIRTKEIADYFWPGTEDKAVQVTKVSKLISKLKEKLSLIMMVEFVKTHNTYMLKCRLYS